MILLKLFIANCFCCFINMQIKKICIRVWNRFRNTGFFQGRVFNSFFIGFLHSTTWPEYWCSGCFDKYLCNYQESVNSCPSKKFLFTTAGATKFVSYLDSWLNTVIRSNKSRNRSCNDWFSLCFIPSKESNLFVWRHKADTVGTVIQSNCRQPFESLCIVSVRMKQTA